MSAAFHLNNKVAKRELEVNLNNKTLPFCSEHKYLWVTLDRSLTYRRHLRKKALRKKLTFARKLTSLRKKLTSRVAFLRRLAGSGWGASATTLRTTTLALVHSTAEYCAPVWCLNADTRLIDPAINDALRIVTGCLRPTPACNLPILAGIQPAELRRIRVTLSPARDAMEPEHLLHSALTCPTSANARRIKSTHPFLPATQQLISSSHNNNMRAAHWADHQWNGDLADNPASLRIFIPDTSTHPPGRPSQEVPGSDLTASAPAPGVSAHVCTNGCGLLCGLWVWRRRTNRRPCHPSMSNPTTSSWTAWPKGSGRWHSRMAAQHLPRDLMNAAKQWLEQLAQKKKKKSDAIYRHRQMRWNLSETLSAKKYNGLPLLYFWFESFIERQSASLTAINLTG